MRTYFTVKVKYAKENDQGLLKSITEHYLVDAVSFTEAETIIYDKVADMIRGDFQITHESKSNIADVFQYPDSDIWHSAKVSYLIVDTDSGKEKKIVQTMLVTAQDCLEAYKRIQESLKDSLASFRITDVKETAILDVFVYERKEVESEA